MTYISTIIPRSELTVSEALKKMKNQADYTSPANMPLSAQVLTDLDTFVTSYDAKYPIRNLAVKNQTSKTHEKNQHLISLHRYTADFFDELNKLIRRNKPHINNGFNPSARKYYNLPKDSEKLPDMGSESKLLYWAEQVITGEPQRITDGGTPISSPTWQEIKTLYDELVILISELSVLKLAAKMAQKDITDTIKTGIEYYLNGRDDLEYYFRKMTDSEKRSILETWGIIYKTLGTDPDKVSTVVGFISSEGIPLEDVKVKFIKHDISFNTREDGSITSHEIPIGITDIELSKPGYETKIITGFEVKPNYDNVFEEDLIMTSPLANL